MAKTIIKPPLPILDRSHPLAKPLVGCWPFFERGGTTLHDISGRGNHGTLTNMNPAAAWVRTTMGSGLKLDGVDDYVNCGTDSSLKFNSGNFTIEAWIYPTATDGVRTIGATYLDPNTGYLFAIYNGAISYYTNAWKAGVAIVANQLQHAAITVNSAGNYIFYINGVSAGSGASALPASNTAYFQIGAYESGTLGRFSGTIVNVRNYKSVLSNRQIAQLYADPWAMYRTLPLYTMGSIPTIPTLRTLSLMGVGR